MAWLKVVISLLSSVFGYLRERQLIEAGKKEAQGEQDRATLETIKAVHAPITDDDRERVWSRLQAERDKGRVPDNPGS